MPYIKVNDLITKTDMYINVNNVKTIHERSEDWHDQGGTVVSMGTFYILTDEPIGSLIKRLETAEELIIFATNKQPGNM